VDIEDLGLNSLAPDRLAAISLNDLTPAALQHTHQQQQQQQQSASFDRALQQLQPGNILAPSSLQQLLAVLSAAAEAQLPVHLLGGNTGAGLYKEQWGRLSSSVCVLVRGVSELQQITVTGGLTEGALPTARQNAPAAATATAAAADGFGDSDSFVGAAEVNSISDKKAGVLKTVSGDSSSSIGAAVIAGAGVTISRLLETLQDTADALLQSQQGSTVAADTDKTNSTNTNNTATSHSALSASASARADPQPQQQQQQQGDVSNLQYMICHMRRIAGTLVRNSATLGGHLALARSHQLESDLVTLMVAAGEGRE
jgi:hypothetical protein